jgi:hypothetical protein
MYQIDKFNQEGLSWDLSPNHFTDWLPEEAAGQLMQQVEPPIEAGRV